MSAASIAMAAATATPLVLPTVPEIFAAGQPLSNLTASQFWDGIATLQSPYQYLSQDFDGLYYQIGYLWPMVETTGAILDSNNCTLRTCSLLFGSFLYLPNLAANAFFAGIFGVLLLCQTYLSIRQRAWGFLAGMVGGLLLEVLGYVGRVMANGNDFSSNPFYLYIICLTIGPAFLSASIYLCLARIVVVYGKSLSRFKPMTYTYIFVGCDFVSLVLQAAGGGLASTSNTQAGSRTGVNIMIAGLAWQVVSLTVFMVLSADFALRVYRHSARVDPTYSALRRSRMFVGFLFALLVATLAIYARSVFRVAELQQGFHSLLANTEVTFMVLEATMITLAVLLMTVFHPTIVFGDVWREVTKKMSGPKETFEKGSLDSPTGELTGGRV